MQTILVARGFDDFSRTLKAADFNVLNLPLIKTEPLNDLSDFENKIAQIEEYDGIFLTSAAATRIFTEKLRESNVEFDGEIYVLGKRSYEMLKTKKIKIVFDETTNTVRELLEKIVPEHLKDKRFLFVRGTKSLRIVPEFLAKTQAKVDETSVYATQKIICAKKEIESLHASLSDRKIVCACFFSPSAAETFIERFGAKILHQTKIATIGKTTANFFAEQDLTVDFISPKTAAKDFAESLIEYLRKEN